MSRVQSEAKAERHRHCAQNTVPTLTFEWSNTKVGTGMPRHLGTQLLKSPYIIMTKILNIYLTFLHKSGMRRFVTISYNSQEPCEDSLSFTNYSSFYKHIHGLWRLNSLPKKKFKSFSRAKVKFQKVKNKVFLKSHSKWLKIIFEFFSVSIVNWYILPRHINCITILSFILIQRFPTLCIWQVYIYTCINIYIYNYYCICVYDVC